MCRSSGVSVDVVVFSDFARVCAGVCVRTCIDVYARMRANRKAFHRQGLQAAALPGVGGVWWRVGLALGVWDMSRCRLNGGVGRLAGAWSTGASTPAGPQLPLGGLCCDVLSMR